MKRKAKERLALHSPNYSFNATVMCRADNPASLSGVLTLVLGPKPDPCRREATKMPFVRIEHSVPNFEKWKQVFDRDPAHRKGSGVRRYQILRPHDDPNYVMVDLEFDSVAEAEAFLRKMQKIWGGAGKAVMQNPRSYIVDRVEDKVP
jgi:hypothetical protein